VNELARQIAGSEVRKVNVFGFEELRQFTIDWMNPL